MPESQVTNCEVVLIANQRTNETRHALFHENECFSNHRIINKTIKFETFLRFQIE